LKSKYDDQNISIYDFAGLQSIVDEDLTKRLYKIISIEILI